MPNYTVTELKTGKSLKIKAWDNTYAAEKFVQEVYGYDAVPSQRPVVQLLVKDKFEEKLLDVECIFIPHYVATISQPKE